MTKHVVEQSWPESKELCLAFANTVHWHASDAPLETLHTYGDLLLWVEQHHAIPVRIGAILAEAAHQQAAHAEAVFERGISLREAIYRVFAAHVSGQAPAQDDLASINHELEIALQHASIARQNTGFGWVWVMDGSRLDTPLWPLVRSAADLLTTVELLARIGQCADDRGCGWLFLDLSKNHTRRWCDINDCGNRAKQRRFQARTRNQTS